MPPERLIFEWVDIAGGFLRSSGWILAGHTNALLAAALQAASNGELRFLTQGLPTIGTATPSGAQYRLTQDVAQLNFATIPGQSLQLVVPAPQNAVFGPNSTVVDPTNALVASIIAQTIGTVSDEFGNAVTAYIGGSKGSRRTEQL